MEVLILIGVVIAVGVVWLIVKCWKPFLALVALFGFSCIYNGFIENILLIALFCIMSVFIICAYATYKNIFKQDNSEKWYKCLLVLSVLSSIIWGVTFSFQLRIDYLSDKIHDNMYLERLNKYYSNCHQILNQDIVVLKISCHAFIDYNNHVGNSWGFYHFINGEEIEHNTIMKYHYGDNISISSTAVEFDNYNDYGSANQTICIEKEEAVRGITAENLVYVRENRGKYSGNTALICFRYRCQIAFPEEPQKKDVIVPNDSIKKYFWRYNE